jgi:hypothetical protein
LPDLHGEIRYLGLVKGGFKNSDRPTSKRQRNSNFSKLNTDTAEGNLNVEVWSFFGTWTLEFGALPAATFYLHLRPNC